MLDLNVVRGIMKEAEKLRITEDIENAVCLIKSMVLGTLPIKGVKTDVYKVGLVHNGVAFFTNLRVQADYNIIMEILDNNFQEGNDTAVKFDLLVNDKGFINVRIPGFIAKQGEKISAEKLY